MNSHYSALMSRLGHRSWRSPVWSGDGCGRSLPGASSDLDAKGNHEPLLIGVPRTTDHLSRTKNSPLFLRPEISWRKGVTILLRIPSVWGGVDPRSAKPSSLEKVTHLMRIQFAIKAENLWKNPIICSGNPFEEGTPFQRIRYRKLETHGVKVRH